MASNEVISMTTIEIRLGNCRVFSKLLFEKLAKLITAVRHQWPDEDLATISLANVKTIQTKTERSNSNKPFLEMFF